MHHHPSLHSSRSLADTGTTTARSTFGMVRLLNNMKGLAAVGLILLATVLSASPAGAHTGFESSSPADGEVIAEPVSEISLTFTGDATPAGEGFVVLDPTGTVREPDDISTVDNRTWTLRFDEPLAGGDVGVRWMVAAPDAHPIDGSFSFAITAPAPEPPEPIAVEDEANVTAEQPTPAPAAADEPVDLDTFLEDGQSGPSASDPIASGARVASILGAILVIGGAAFAAFGLRGDASDVRAVLYWVRRGGVLLIIGAVAEAATMTAVQVGEWSLQTSPTDVADVLWSSAGLAIVLRAAGGFLATSKTGLDTMAASAAGDPVVAARQLATVGGGHSTPPPAGRASDEPFVYANDHAWNHRLALGGLLGVALVAVSFMFDGHTASEGPRLLHAVANLTHVTTAAIWAGGVAMLALTIHRRRNDDRPTQALQLAMRFSVVATIALVAAGIAGTALSILVVDSVSDLWATPWGRLLALKVAFVAAAAAGGAYNHRVIVPALDRNPADQATIDRFRAVVTIEAAALLAVAVVTAFLIAASAA